MGYNGADEVGTYAFGLNAGQGLHEVVHVEYACVVKPAFRSGRGWFARESDRFRQRYVLHSS